MKSSVLTVLMLMMVLGFGINAFAKVSPQAVSARLKQLIPAGHSGIMEMGTQNNGKDCEVSISLNPKGEAGVMISARTMFAMAHYSFDLQRRRTLTAAADRGNQIVIESINEQGLAENLVLELVKSNNGRVLRSAEIVEQVEGFFGTKMKSQVKCSI